MYIRLFVPGTESRKGATFKIPLFGRKGGTADGMGRPVHLHLSLAQCSNFGVAADKKKVTAHLALRAVTLSPL